MTILDFADKYLKPYTVKGDEIVPDLCPYCNGGNRRDKGTFAMNATTGTYNCKRGTCKKSGSYWQLCKDFGEQPAQDGQRFTPKQRTYVKPQTQPKQGVSAYLTGRGISAETQAAYKIGTDGKGNIVFPFYEAGELVFVKFRPAHDVKDGERKAWREKDTKPVLFGMDLCDAEKPLCIFEGEIDALSGHEAGIPNCVSVPSGAEDMTWIETCWEWLHRFKKVYLFGDNDDPGRAMVRAVSVRLSDMMIFRVEHDRKDANEMLLTLGKESISRAYSRAKEVTPVGLISLADVRPLNVKSIPSCQSGIQELDRKIGGFLMGDMSVWTGKRGEGKSTLLGQLMLEAIDSGHRVCAYSGELAADRLQYWLNLQAAGKDCISVYHDDKNDRDVSYVDNSILAMIREWYRGRFWLYDNMIAGGDEHRSVLEVFEMAARRYGCNVFLIDNLMTCDYQQENERDYYRAQSKFVGKLVDFARKYNVHVHLVAHPKKKEGDIENDDVSGSADITNRAANVFLFERVPEAKRGSVGFDAMLSIKKNRWDGAIGKIGLDYEPKSRRLYLPSVGDNATYGWGGDQVEIDDEALPF